MGKKSHDKLKKRVKTAGTILKFVLLLIIILGIPAYIYFGHHELIEQFSSLDDVRDMLNDYKGYTILVYLAAQAIQVVICVIPGQMLQFAAAYTFGFWMGLLWSLIGAAIGAFIAYHLAGLLGRGVLYLIFDEEKMDYFVEKLNSKKAVIAVFVIYVIPGLPKDACAYAAGISNMKLKVFMIISTIGRMPGIIGSLLIGHQLGIGSYTVAIIIGVIAIVLFTLGAIFRNKITDWLDRVYDKLYS